MAEQEASSVGAVVDALRGLAEQEEQVTVGDVTRAFGGTGFGPLMLAPAILVISPLGGIPVFPTLMALMILLFAVQMVFRRRSIWLPSMLEERSVADEKVTKAADRLKPIARWLDRVTGERLTFLTEEPVPSISAGIIVLLCLSVPFSELVPFAALLPMGAIAMLAIGLTVRDGLMMLVGLICSAGALAGLYLWVF